MGLEVALLIYGLLVGITTIVTSKFFGKLIFEVMMEIRGSAPKMYKLFYWQNIYHGIKSYSTRNFLLGLFELGEY